MNKSAEAFRTISEVSDELDVPKHVLRFWEARFPQIKPMKRGGGRRYYRPEDVELLKGIRHLLHAEGYTIRGVQKILRQQGVDEVKNSAERAARGVVASAPSAAPAASRAQTRSRTPGATAAAGSEQVGQESTRVLLAAIAELEALRALLRGEEPRAADRRKAAAGGRRSRAGR